MAELEIKDLHVNVEGKEILKGVNLNIERGRVHAVMGPNGAGKSTVANTLAAHPHYKVISGKIIFRGQDITEMGAAERAQLGMFMAFQYPAAVPGVSVVSFLRSALNAQRKTRDEESIGLQEFRKLLEEKMTLLKVDREFTRRYLNDGFSGGEKKRCEILQMAVLKPSLAILDETDSGLDIDALRTVAEAVETMRGPDLGVLLITHYQRILNYIRPDFVHILMDGRIVAEGGAELAESLEERGYEWLREEDDKHGDSTDA